jgi:hypothetical protein
METIIAAVGQLAEPAVKDAYEALKTLIVGKLGKDHPVAAAVEDFEKKPQSKGRQETLKEELADSGIAADPKIVSAAQALLEQAGDGVESRKSVQTVIGHHDNFSTAWLTRMEYRSNGNASDISKSGIITEHYEA